jgi:hypothetical protein
VGASKPRKQTAGNAGAEPAKTGGGLFLLLGGAVLLLLVLVCGGVAVVVYVAFVRPGGSVSAGPITMANFDRIRGGMSEADVEAILGKPTNADTNLDANDRPLVAERGRAQLWSNREDHIIVAYCDHKAVSWHCMIGGKFRIQTDRTYAWFNQPEPPPTPSPKPDPKPDPNGKLTQAAFDAIVIGKSTRAEVEAALGPPKEVRPDPSARLVKHLALYWVEGQIFFTVFVREDNGVVTGKSSNLK